MAPQGTRAVILAGGRGTRLAPYTSVLPKPLMPVGDRAILELVVDQLEDCGINDVTFCVGYLSHLIRAVFDNRANGHVRVRYVHEQEALGTAGPLRLVDGLEDTFIAMNGDVLTNLDYCELVGFHREQGNAITIATHDRSIKIDYGVLELDDATGARIDGYREKPEIVSTVSMGIYVLEPWVVDYVPGGRPFDVPDLVQALLSDGHRLGAYRYGGMWFDIGREEDYQQAVAAWLEQEMQAPANGNGHKEVATLDSIGVPVGNGHNGSGHNGNGNGHNGNGRQLDRQLLGAAAAAASAGEHGADCEQPVMEGELRETLSRVPCAVTVVTTLVEDRVHGTTVSSFTSLSAEPPLVTIALGRTSDLLELLEPSCRFTVNLLAAGQEELGRACAQKGEDKLTDVEMDETDGFPLIRGAAGWINCEVRELISGGDHVIIVGEVIGSDVTDDALPLVYHRRRFLELAS